jgi:hypothetical protein
MNLLRLTHLCSYTWCVHTLLPSIKYVCSLLQLHACSIARTSEACCKFYKVLTCWQLLQQYAEIVQFILCADAPKLYYMIYPCENRHSRQRQQGALLASQTRPVLAAAISSQHHHQLLATAATARATRHQAAPLLLLLLPLLLIVLAVTKVARSHQVLLAVLLRRLSCLKECSVQEGTCTTSGTG